VYVYICMYAMLYCSICTRTQHIASMHSEKYTDARYT